MRKETQFSSGMQVLRSRQAALNGFSRYFKRKTGAVREKCWGIREDLEGRGSGLDLIKILYSRLEH